MTSEHDLYKCDVCDAKGVRLWRRTTLARPIKCATCIAAQALHPLPPVRDDGKWWGAHGWVDLAKAPDGSDLCPAVVNERLSRKEVLVFFPFGDVPDEAVEGWRKLPNFPPPKRCPLCNEAFFPSIKSSSCPMCNEPPPVVSAMDGVRSALDVLDLPTPPPWVNVFLRATLQMLLVAQAQKIDRQALKLRRIHVASKSMREPERFAVCRILAGMKGEC